MLRVSMPPGGAMEAPKDPDTRPGPPPSASVPLGMGMYSASALDIDRASQSFC